MTPKDVEAEIIRDPFIPVRLHLGGGKTLNINNPGVALLMQNALVMLHQSEPGKQKVDNYDVVAFRNIERIQQRPARRRKAG